MILPGLLYFIVFKYIPLGGSVIAFQDYNLLNGVFHSKLSETCLPQYSESVW